MAIGLYALKKIKSTKIVSVQNHKPNFVQK
jgi:hypothetical protein